MAVAVFASAAIGGAVGGLLLVLLLVAVALWYAARRRRANHQQQHDPFAMEKGDLESASDTASSSGGGGGGAGDVVIDRGSRLAGFWPFFARRGPRTDGTRSAGRPHHRHEMHCACLFTTSLAKHHMSHGFVSSLRLTPGVFVMQSSHVLPQFATPCVVVRVITSRVDLSHVSIYELHLHPFANGFFVAY